MKLSKIYSIWLKISVLAIFTVFAAYLSGCSNNSTSSDDGTFLQTIVTGGSQYSTDEDNLMYNEKSDLNDSVAVGDNGDSPIDSLKRWGRIIENVNVNVAGSFSGDTLYTANVTRTISGHYKIIGWKGGQLDTVNKPYQEVFKRVISFKRVNRTPYPYLNWRLYQVSCLSGGTTSPQVGTSNTQITQIQYQINGGIQVTWAPANGDFTQINFITKRFDGTGIPKVHIGDYVDIYVTVNSSEINNYVAWHWARNSFGFHREPFAYVSSQPNGQNGFTVVFYKRFYIYSGHKLGAFNGYISASTHESLYDDNTGLFSSTEVGIPYRVEAP